MHPLDIDAVRDAEIALHGLSEVDRQYTFYHDETNNVRKLHVANGALNVAELKVFCLGGVVHEGPPRSLDITGLRDALRIQPSARELKLKHIAKGDFLELLHTNKLKAFLNWLSAGGLLIHYHELDPLFWSTVDIVDSILAAREDLQHLHPFHIQLKSDLVSVLREDLPATIQLFHAYGYPSLAPEDRAPFIRDLLAVLEQNEDAIDHFNFMMLKGVIQAGRDVDELVFIEGNIRHILIEQFADFYRSRIVLFKYSSHVFDAEDTVRDELVSVPLESGGAPFVNYRFADSELEPGIQVSDIVVGLLGKMHSYFTEKTPQQVDIDRDALSGTSLDNALLLRDLLATSDAANIAFQHHTATLYDRDKADRFLRFTDGRYAS